MKKVYIFMCNDPDKATMTINRLLATKNFRLLDVKMENCNHNLYYTVIYEEGE